jgi:tryptophanyl-tRNA synthetase
LEKEFKGKGYEEFKKSLIEILINSLKPLREKRKELLKRGDYLKGVLKKGAEKAKKLAKLTMAEVRKKIGLMS